MEELFRKRTATDAAATASQDVTATAKPTSGSDSSTTAIAAKKPKLSQNAALLKTKSAIGKVCKFVILPAIATEICSFCVW